VQNFNSSAHIPSPRRHPEDSVKKYLAAKKVVIKKDPAKQAMTRYDAICDLISCIFSITSGSQHRVALEDTQPIEEPQVTFIDPSYEPFDLIIELAYNSLREGWHTPLAVKTEAISSKFNPEAFAHITRGSIVCSAASKNTFPIKDVIKRERVAIFWHFGLQRWTRSR
jgi:hypothetical protein